MSRKTCSKAITADCLATAPATTRTAPSWAADAFMPICSNIRCEENYHEKFNPPKKDPKLCDKCGHELIQRSDDKLGAIKHRLELYHKDTQPLIDLYRERGILVEVNGEQPIADVEVAINAELGLL